MGKWIRRILMIVLAVVFLGSAAMVITVQHQYSVSKKLYSDAADRFTVEIPSDGGGGGGTGGGSGTAAPDSDADAEPVVIAPIKVDFDALLAECPDVVGWIYCEDTPINYPVVQADDDDYYLHRSYDGTYSASGSIFVEAKNRRGFLDANTIIYGHHMKNGSMFAGLDKWASQEYFDSHREMWLLTPTQDYRMDIVSGYTTKATSDTYTVFSAPCDQLNDYLDSVFSQSDFESGISPDPNGKYVVLSTCAYVFDYARYVVHCQLVPVQSVGGVLLAD